MPSLPDTATRGEFAARGGSWPPSRRLLRRADFLAIYDQGMRRGSPHFTLFGRLRRPCADRAADRFGITVTRKLGNAVVRNRLRRRTRELLRRLEAGAAPLPACDFVVHPRPAVASAGLALLAHELEAGLSRLRQALLPKDS
ncbi:MAG: ribonuclease P protein component [Terriglobales bacterium]